MKYFIRSVKYFIYFCAILAIMVGALILIGAAEANIETLFRGGYDALWKIAALFAVISAIYPKVGFIRREASVPGNWDEIKGDIRRYMEENHYDFEKEEAGSMSFRHKGFASRLSRMFEDRIVITPAFGGVTVDGPRKDAIRVATGIEYRMEKSESDE
ncbi:MAG: hypothetical protein J6B62_10550 [Bacteroidales bacterium]|nr:hypothetical protein [Bacteroidales bacterium]